MTAAASMALRARCNRFLVAALVATATMLFASFTGAYLMRRAGMDWKPVPLPSMLMVSTAAILLSSVLLETAKQIRRRWAVRAAIGLGFVFLGSQGAAFWQLRQAGFLELSRPHGAFLVVLVCVHAVHAIGGMLFLAAVPKRPSLDGVATGWWHFVGLVWLYVLWLISLG